MQATRGRPTEWINGVEAGKILGVNSQAVRKMARQGLLGIRNLPVKAKYRREDVERIARECVKPATR